MPSSSSSISVSLTKSASVSKSSSESSEISVSQSSSESVSCSSSLSSSISGSKCSSSEVSISSVSISVTKSSASSDSTSATKSSSSSSLSEVYDTGKIAIKFKIGGSYTTFDVDEVGAVEVQPVQSFVLMERQSIKPNLYFEGNTYNTFQVELIDRWKTTLAKIQTVTSAEVEMTIYPCYRYWPTKYYSVVLLPDNIIKTYRYGEREAYVVHQLTFLQSVR